MMYTCTPRAPRHAAAAGVANSTSAASRKIVKRGKKSFAVDLHCRVHVPEADAIIGGNAAKLLGLKAPKR